MRAVRVLGRKDPSIPLSRATSSPTLPPVMSCHVLYERKGKREVIIRPTGLGDVVLDTTEGKGVGGEAERGARGGCSWSRSRCHLDWGGGGSRGGGLDGGWGSRGWRGGASSLGILKGQRGGRLERGGMGSLLSLLLNGCSTSGS